MEELSLSAEKRVIKGKKVSYLRAEGKTPAVIYGPDTEPIMITANRVALEKAYKVGGNSSVIKLNIEGTEYDVLIHDVAFDPLTSFITHVDFYKFKAGQKLNTSITLVFEGEPRTIKEQGAILITQMEELNVICLPKDLVHDIKVDLTTIQTLDDIIRVKDLNIPAGIEPDCDIENTVVRTSVEREEILEEEEEVKTDMPESKTGNKDAEAEEDKKDSK